VEQLKAARWTGSPRTDAEGQCEFRYQPEGGARACRFVALRYHKKAPPKERSEAEQYQLFDTPEYSYRAFVTNLGSPIDVMVGFYRQRAGAENWIKEANNDAGLAAPPAVRWAMNCVLPVGHAGLQPELLAGAVQPRRAGQDRGVASHHTVYRFAKT
jgi:hypothetical protein